MRLKFILVCFFLVITSIQLLAQVSAKMLRYPDVSEKNISFVFGGDIWIVAKEGGLANKLTSPAGEESFPRFSPDGKTVAFSANYDGNEDVYTLPVSGGIPKRITYHGMQDRVIGWHPDGERILFASFRESGRQRFRQFFLVNKDGGLPDKLPLPYGEFGDISEDGKWIAYTEMTRTHRSWKRYRGGTAADILLYNLETFEWQNITDNTANDELPMWNGNIIYFVSDRGESKKFNIWAYNTETKITEQITNFTDFDIHYPSVGPSDIVFEAGGKIFLLDLESKNYKEVNITVVTDNTSLSIQTKNVKDYISSVWIAPDGERAVIEARGDIFSVPAKDGVVLNLTRTSGVAERKPSWSPNGKYIAYWSDSSGEYELTIMDMEKTFEEKTLTSYGPGYRYDIYWSPDSKKMAFIDNTMTIRYYDLDKNKTEKIDQGLWMYQNALANFKIGWSADSRWITYSRGLGNRNNALFIFDTKENLRRQVTSGYYSDSAPEFGADGKYIFFLTNRTFSPVYSDIDNKFIYPNTTNIASVSLRMDVPSPLAPKNDTVKIKKDEEKEEEKEEDADKGKEEEEEEKIEEIKIDFDNFENRVILLPPKGGNYSNIQTVKGKVIYHHHPNSGSSDNEHPIKYFDLEEREEKTILMDASVFIISADGKKMLAGKDKSYAIVDVKADQKMEKKLNVDDLTMDIDPREEWKQLYTDAWRLERDFFYDTEMHGVDWNKMKDKYGALIDNAITRWDVNFLIGELIGELNASHTYRYGGDAEKSKNVNVGYLGINWKLENGYYKISEIINGADWDNEVRSPLAMPGVGVKEGDYILAVNNIPLNVSKDPWASFQGLGNKTVELTVNAAPSMKDSKKVIVQTLNSETRLRHLNWIEKNRKSVDEATDGKVGYIYVRSTGRDGQSELVRQFAAQFNKEGLIIDERFNSGGQIPDRFIELLNRKPLAFWAVRDGATWQSPPVANFGAKVMLINGWSGSGGDAFPDYFRKSGLGPLIGSRTWGGLIGYTGNPSLIDGGGITVPTFRMYDPDGKWFLEGHGVDPDIPVREDPAQLARGTDNQLERAIEEVLKIMKKEKHMTPASPSKEIR